MSSMKHHFTLTLWEIVDKSLIENCSFIDNAESCRAPCPVYRVEYSMFAHAMRSKSKKLAKRAVIRYSGDVERYGL